MYLSNIKIENYRTIGFASVDFQEGINWIDGSQEVGTADLLAAIALIFQGGARRQLSIDDIYDGIGLEELRAHPPVVRITATLTESAGENLMGDELVTVSNWLVTMEEPYAAQLQYEFLLPDTKLDEYRQMAGMPETADDIRDKIKTEFIRYYTYQIWGGNPDSRMRAEGENLRRFDYQVFAAGDQDLQVAAEFLNKMKMASDPVYMGMNAKVCPMPIIKDADICLMEYLKEYIAGNPIRQIWVTTDSSYVTNEAMGAVV